VLAVVNAAQRFSRTSAPAAALPATP